MHFKIRIYLCEITNVFGYDNTNSYKSIRFKYGSRQYNFAINYVIKANTMSYKRVYAYNF